MPGWGSSNNTQLLQQSVAQVAPTVTTMGGPAHGVDIAQAIPQNHTPRGGVLQQFAHFIGGAASEVGHIAEGAASWLATQGKDFGEGAINFPRAIYNFSRGAIDTYEQRNQVNQLTAKQQNLTKQWRSGIISSQEYQAQLKELMNQQNTLNDQLKATSDRLNTSRQEAGSALGTITTVAAAVLTDGLSLGAAEGVDVGTGTAAKFLTSVNANALLDTTEKALTKVASDASLFAKLTPEAQKAIQGATAEVVANAGRATAPQIARAAAVNLAIKYPLYYNAITSNGAQIYNELDNKKYGDAIRTSAFNALLLLSGGPIGQALKYGGKGVGAIVGRTFGRTAFLDALSAGIGNGDPAGLYNAVMKLPASERAVVVKSLSAVEATNLSAVGGKDAAAAATRVLNGMENYEGLSMSQFTHEEALNNMVNFAKAQQLADTAGKAAGLGPITVGRVDARQLNEIASQLAPAAPEDRLKVWDALKSSSPSQAWANNENFDRQIKSLITKHEDPAELTAAISRIKASFSVDGFPESAAKELSKMGYIPIKPVNLEAPFKEGEGKLASKFADGNNDLFIKSVQPLPILSSIGGALTNMGLSPNASTARVYQMFNENLAVNLKDSGVIPDIMGESANDTTDTLIKKLSSYAHNPTNGKIASKMPITDLRMLTLRDIKAALEVNTREATLIQKSISQAYIQVPIAIRGLGDRVVDLGYNNKLVGALQRRYIRLMGAARFSWNPFFQYLRVIPKTETLASFEGGGFINSVFSGRAGEINKIRTELRASGMLDESGFTTSGEAADFGGSMSKNLSKKLLPMQERSIAGLIDSQAQRMGMDWQDYVKNYPDNVRNTIQAIAEYDKQGNFINSPLARTLNIAFFPFRFDVKVATIMARGLARTSLMTQVAVIHGMMQAHDFLNSAEGKAWYQKNADAIGLFNYITPVAHLNEVFQALLPGHDHSLGNFGELGGLPFGFIPQLLDSEGITNFNQPGVDAKTGAIIPQYIPVTARGQVATAIQDFLGTLYSYPGATAGLPSKTGIDRSLGLGFVGGSKTKDLQLTNPTTGATVSSLANTSPGQVQDYPQNLQQNVKPIAPPMPPGKSSSSSSRTKKLKKSQFKPALLPGQSQLGQL